MTIDPGDDIDRSAVDCALWMLALRHAWVWWNIESRLAGERALPEPGELRVSVWLVRGE